MITIEKAVLEDAAIMTEIKTRAYNKEINTYLGRDGGPEGYNEISSEEYIIEHFIAYKIVLEGRIIGAFFLISLGEDEMQFEDFVIDPEEQNKGYGYKVLNLLEKAYPSIKIWHLSTPTFSVGNQHLYEKFGYQREVEKEDEIIYIKHVYK